MQRNIIEQLRRWKDKKNRKPLVLAGARQVGKTYILKEFGKTEFSNVAYINCDDNELAKDLLVAENGMEESKGAFTENFVMSQLVATRDTSVFYYCNDAKLEIDFLIQQDSQIVPIEAKAEENLRSKSLSSFVSSHPETHGIRFSMSDYREQDWLTNVPLYAVSTYFNNNNN